MGGTESMEHQTKRPNNAVLLKRQLHARLGTLRTPGAERPLYESFDSILKSMQLKRVDNVSESVLRKVLQLVWRHHTGNVLDKPEEDEIVNLMRMTSTSSFSLAVLLSYLLYWKRRDTTPRAALVIVDMQNDFISGSLALRDCPGKEEAAEVVPIINKLRVEAAFDMVVLTQDWHPKDHCSFHCNVANFPLSAQSSVQAKQAKLFDKVTFADGMEQVLWPAHCMQGSHGAQIVDGLAVLPTDEFVKKGTSTDVDSYSAFFDNGRIHHTNLESMLQQADITDVYVVGLAYDVCVRYTALDSVDCKFKTYVIRDACRSVSPEGAEETTQKLRSMGVTLLNASEVPERLA
eukprot:m.35963 g.35963  ORF g.35963 m.35963 type:complete len:347 (-) comp13339_c0_seq1:39-1079(-)